MINDKTLKIAFLWHQHQPYYKIDNEFILPWVLLHGTKDYYDLPEVLYEFPSIKQTFNFAPSLNLQIDDYVRSRGTDKIRTLTAKRVDLLTRDDKSEILKYFFHANLENMIKPNPRFFELYIFVQNHNDAIDRFNDRDWLDLQIWYNLSWFGYYSSQTGLINRLRNKGSDFTEEEKALMIQEQNFLLSKIVNQYKKLRDLKQIEISCSPMFHPILPLLCDSRSALESNPDNMMPEPIFSYPEDAKLQLSSGIDYFVSIFGEKPNGLWPSEGSVSNDVLNLMINQGLNWFASDELVLANSVENSHLPIDKYFPRKFVGTQGEITGFFRDHNLSDKIGFLYSNWNESDAANDFVNNLLFIRDEIYKVYGDDGLKNAVVPVILDGENCWEFYKKNGIPFLRELFLRIDKSPDLKTVTFNEVVSQSNSNTFLPPLKSIRAGSWINANFNIWIGHEDDIKAWNVLSKARAAFEKHRFNISEDTEKAILTEIMIAEGSDWFWWYGPEHHTDNKPEFDLLFRHHVAKIYELLNLDIPNELMTPITKHSLNSSGVNQRLNISPDLSKSPISESWSSAQVIDINIKNTSMHRSGNIVEMIKYFVDDSQFFFGIKLSGIKHDYNIRVAFETAVEIILSRNSSEITSKCVNAENFILSKGTSYVNFTLPLRLIQSNDKSVNIRIIVDSPEEIIKFPEDGFHRI